MNQIDNSEIIEEIKHNEKILKLLKMQLRDREIIAIQHGIMRPISIVNELHEINELIQDRTDTITRLRSQLVEDKLTLAEARYRLLIAESWNTPQGSPDLIGRLRLEIARLEGSMKIENAQMIEQEVRIQLAEEAIPLIWHPKKWDNREFDFNKLFTELLRVMRLDFNTGISFFINHIFSTIISTYSFQGNADKINVGGWFVTEDTMGPLLKSCYFAKVDDMYHPISSKSFSTFLERIVLSEFMESTSFIEERDDIIIASVVDTIKLNINIGVTIRDVDNNQDNRLIKIKEKLLEIEEDQNSKPGINKRH